MSAQADIFTEREGWRGPLGWSLVLHGCLLVSIIVYGLISGMGGESWGSGGSGGGAMSATLVSSAAIPLPPNEMGKSIVAHESPGLSKSLPRQEEKAPEAIPIPEKNAKKKPPKPERPTVAKAKNVAPEPEPENIVPFGQGGPISGPYGVFTAGGAKGGLSFSGTGDFGSRFGWYVDVVRRKISENWLKYEIDPRVEQRAARVHHLRHPAQRAADQRAGGAVERRSFAGCFGDARHPAYRHFRCAAARLQRRQGFGGVLVRLQEMSGLINHQKAKTLMTVSLKGRSFNRAVPTSLFIVIPSEARGSLATERESRDLLRFQKGENQDSSPRPHSQSSLGRARNDID